MNPQRLQRDDASCSSSTSCSSDDDLSFTNLDFEGVNFDHNDDVDNNVDNDVDAQPSKSILSNNDKLALSYERRTIDNNNEKDDDYKNDNKNDNNDEGTNDATIKENDDSLHHIIKFFHMINDGRYLDVLHSPLTIQILSGTTTSSNNNPSSNENNVEPPQGLVSTIHNRIVSYCNTVSSCVIVELIGIASLSLFLQLNYTGPTFDESSSQKERLEEVNPHDMFRCRSMTTCDDDDDDDEGETKSNDGTTATTTTTRNMILSELEVDGDLPFGLCDGPYFLLLSRVILSTLSLPLLINRADNSNETTTTTILGESYSNLDYWLRKQCVKTTSIESHLTFHLSSSLYNWNARATIAHQRTLPITSSSVPSPTLWKETLFSFDICLSSSSDADKARVTLEWGLAQHYFERDGRGISSFRHAEELSGLVTNVTGAEGKRTKFQQKATAQMIVTTSTTTTTTTSEQQHPETTTPTDDVVTTSTPTAIPLDHDTHLLERISYTDPTLNTTPLLSKLHLSILLALCLDVRNINPSGNEDLTSEQMMAYLDRIIHTTSHESHDWTIYSTALLERAWLEHSRPNRRERSILQIQALFDQHTTRLTLTQSTTESAATSAATAPQRLSTIHVVVYPPRWELMKDLADRYATMGMFTTASELYRELECWDAVVDCLKACGREGEAKQLVEERLSSSRRAARPTARLWCAYGDLQSNDEDAISSFQKAVELSNERYAPAYEKWGRRHFDAGRLSECISPWTRCLKLKPLQPSLWFTRGTVHMRLSQWDDALHCFSEVVVQEPEEGDAWSNIAAIHMQRNNSQKAYGAIQESLKRFRKNWRVWNNKLYVCLDLNKFDEAVQACRELIDFYKKNKKEEDVIEEKCVKAIVVGVLKGWEEAVGARDEEGGEEEEGEGKEEEHTEDDVVDQTNNADNDDDDDSSDDDDDSHTNTNNNTNDENDQKRNAAISSWKQTLSRVKILLDELSTTLSHPWIFETKAYFDARLGQSSSIVLSHLQKEYRTLQTRDGWEMDGDALKKIVTVAEQMVECYREGGREELVKGRFMLKTLIKKVEGGYLEEDVPEEVEVLRVRLEELTRLIKECQ